MKKQGKQLCILGGLLVLCLLLFGGAKLLNAKQSSDQEEAARQESESLQVHTLAKDTICKISYEYEGYTIVLVKEDSLWKAQGEPDRNLKTTYITTMTNQLAAVDAQTVIEDVTDLEQYGLAEGYRTISCETTEGETFTYYLGDQNGITGNFYIRLPEEETTVYAVSNLYSNAFSYSLEDLTEVEEETESLAEDMTDNTTDDLTDVEE